MTRAKGERVMCDRCDWKEAMELCNSILLEWEDCEFAEGLYRWMCERAHITQKQWDALLELGEKVGVI